MPKKEELGKWRAGLHANLPVVGSRRRHWAMDALETHRNETEVVPLLVEALAVGDATIVRRAASALTNLTRAPAINTLCNLWVQKRNGQVGRIIARRHYMATEPLEVRVLSGLKATADHVLTQVDAEPIPFLIAALDDVDLTIRQRALTVLQELKKRQGIDALIAVWAERRDERLGRVIANRNYVASGPLPLRVLSALKASANDLLLHADADAIPHLAAALDDADAVIRHNAWAVLRALKNPHGVDALCAAWTERRDERLGRVIALRTYVATQPLPLRVLSALKASANEILLHADAEPIPHLVAALDDADPTIQQNAWAVLEGLKNPEGINALCALWSQNENENERLGNLITRRNYVATEPLQLRILTMLKCGKRVVLDQAYAVPFLTSLLSDSDPIVRASAVKSLEQVAPGAAQDALCEEAIKSPKGEAARLCLRMGKRPGNHERLCLFLFVTALLDRRQLDHYFNEDPQFQTLRFQFMRADVAVQEHVLEVARFGDPRCAGLFKTRNRPLTECTDTELRLAIKSWLYHADWTSLFQACLELPLRWSLAALKFLRDSNWEPEPPELNSLYREILGDGLQQALAAADPANAAISFLEQWLARGVARHLVRLNDVTPRERLKATATPLEGVAVVGALAGKKEMYAADFARTVEESPHWLVRLAGHETGLYASYFPHRGVEDANYWINALDSATRVLDFWPGKATPEELQDFLNAPPEAWMGKLGAARRVLRTIVEYRQRASAFVPMVIEVDEYAGDLA